jgi:GYF domain 2
MPDPDPAFPTLIVAMCFLWFVLSLAVAWAADQRKRDSGSWFVLSVILSPVLALLLLMAVGDGKPESTPAGTSLALASDISAMRAQREYHRVLAQAAGLPKPLLSKWHIARGSDNLGEFSHSQILEFLQAGALTPSDLYWDTQAHEWLELAAHPRLA